MRNDKVPAPRLSRRRALVTLAAPLAASLSGSMAGCLSPDWRSTGTSTFTIATGNRGGVFNRYGEALGAVLTERLDGLTARARATDASVANIRLVADGGCDLGFSLGDTASDAVRGSGPFSRPTKIVALARTYDSFTHLVVRVDSGLSTVADLRGKRVGLGAPGSGTRFVAQRILRQSGLALTDVEVASESLEASADALRAGDLAAFFFVSGLPNEAVRSLTRDVPVRLVELDGVVDAMVSAYGPEYVRGPIPASTYDLAEGVETVSVKNYLVATPDMSDDLAYAVTRVMFEAQDEIQRRAPGVRQPALGAAIFTSPLDLHPGAVRYFREGRR
ncbi:MAG: TAXI family TRAP transporter solute-binding subunit [Nocardioides sp.]|nr:TAXI family TRAP transporter solute-binding subunit [Nocardioides sp.]